MRTLVTRMKFELNSSLAVLTAAIGLNFAQISFLDPLWLELFMAAAAIYLFWEGWTTVSLLREVREQMQQPITIVSPEGLSHLFDRERGDLQGVGEDQS